MIIKMFIFLLLLPLLPAFYLLPIPSFQPFLLSTSTLLLQKMISLQEIGNQLYYRVKGFGVLKPLAKHSYYIEFEYQGQCYKICLVMKKGPKPEVFMYDENGNDLSCFLGPNKDLYDAEIRPSHFGVKDLHIIKDGQKHFYSSYKNLGREDEF